MISLKYIKSDYEIELDDTKWVINLNDEKYRKKIYRFSIKLCYKYCILIKY